MTATKHSAGSPVSDRLLVLQFMRLLNLVALLVIPVLAGVEARRAVGGRAGLPGRGGGHRGAAPGGAVALRRHRLVERADRRRRGRARRRRHRRLQQPAPLPRVPRRHGGDAGGVLPDRAQARPVVRAALAAAARGGRRRRGRRGERARRPRGRRERDRVPGVRGLRRAVLGDQRARAPQQSRPPRAAGGAGRRARTRDSPGRRARDARSSLVRPPGVHAVRRARALRNRVGRRA